MIEGVSGVLRDARARASARSGAPSRRRLEWPNGAVAQAFSAEDPESLRGPQFAAAWCDELAKWESAEDAFDMLQFGLRLGDAAAPGDHHHAAADRADQAAGQGRPHRGDARADHRQCARTWRRRSSIMWSRAIDGTRLGRQELDGEIIEERADALWSRALIEQLPRRGGAAARIASWSRSIRRPRRRQGADACGIVAAGVAEDGTLYVIADETAAGLTPAGWARRAVALWRRLQADALVVEVNQGGEMVKAVIGEADANVPVDSVRAKQGQVAARRAGRRAVTSRAG